MIAGEHRLALPAGFQLGKYRFKEVLGAGGFGITYLADDESLGRRVAIKELLPNDIATRIDGSTVVAKTKSEEDNLAWARDRFLKEGRALAACEHPNVVHVYEMLEANGTAYMVTKFEDGRSFAEWLKGLDGPPKEKDLRAILLPLLSGLEKVHKAGFLHRDLKPENIYITREGQPVLLDFGSARQAVSDRTSSLTSIVTAGYAPFEQYHEDGKQGAWTDLYAMAAVMYRAIHGKKPPEATRRLQDDPSVKLAREYAGKYSAPFLQAIDKALAMDVARRPQTVAVWRQMLGEAPADAVEKKIVADPKLVREVEKLRVWARENPMLAMAGAVAGVLIVLLGGIKLLWPSSPPHPPIADVTPAPKPPIAIVTPAPSTPSASTPVPSTPLVAVVTPPPVVPQPATPAPQMATPFPFPPATPAPQRLPEPVEPPRNGFIAGLVSGREAELPPVEVPEGQPVVDRRLVAIWEYRPGSSSAGAVRWEQQASGRYTLARGGELFESGESIAREGRLQQRMDGPEGRLLATYRVKTTTQLVTNGPQGEITWKRIKALPAEPTPAIVKRDPDGPGTRPHQSEPRPQPKPRPPEIERRMKDLGNSIRRRLPF